MGSYFLFWKPWLMLLYLLLALPLESCAQAPRSISEKGSIPIPEAAYDVERHSLESESAYQIDFKINAVYPDTKAASFYTELFSEFGWHACTNNDEWVEYGKRIVMKPMCQHARNYNIWRLRPKRNFFLWRCVIPDTRRQAKYSHGNGITRFSRLL